MGEAAGVASVAPGDVLYHVPARRILQDVVTCIREGCTIDEVGFRRERSAERAMKAPAQMRRLFDRFAGVGVRQQRNRKCVSTPQSPWFAGER